MSERNCHCGRDVLTHDVRVCNEESLRAYQEGRSDKCPITWVTTVASRPGFRLSGYAEGPPKPEEGA